jgi:hypothetical protein
MCAWLNLPYLPNLFNTPGTGPTNGVNWSGREKVILLRSWLVRRQWTVATVAESGCTQLRVLAACGLRSAAHIRLKRNIDFFSLWSDKKYTSETGAPYCGFSEVLNIYRNNRRILWFSREKNQLEGLIKALEEGNLYDFSCIAVYLVSLEMSKLTVKDTIRLLLKQPSISNRSHKLRSLIKLGVAIYILYRSYDAYFQGTIGHSYMSVIGRWKSSTFQNS